MPGKISPKKLTVKGPKGGKDTPNKRTKPPAKKLPKGKSKVKRSY